jgi:hypothetical protein
MTMRILYGGPPPPQATAARADVAKEAKVWAEDRKVQLDIMRLAGVPDDLAQVALGINATHKDEFSSIDLLRALAALASHASFVERRWATRVKLMESRMDFAREALDGKHDDE